MSTIKCGVCAEPVPGKTFALMVSGKTHLCAGRLVTSKVVSYHISGDAAQRARLAYGKKVPGARTYVLRTKGA